MATGTADRDALIAEFWLHYRLVTGDRAGRLTADEHFWAWEAVDDLMAEGGTEAVELIVDLAEVVAGDDQALCYLGSGPVEALLRGNSTSLEATKALERAAVELPSIRTAVRCVWWATVPTRRSSSGSTASDHRCRCPRSPGVGDILISMNELSSDERREHERSMAQHRLEVVEGLQKALEIGWALHEAIGQAADKAEAIRRPTLPPFDFTEWQAAHVVGMQYGHRTHERRARLADEAKELRTILES